MKEYDLTEVVAIESESFPNPWLAGSFRAFFGQPSVDLWVATGFDLEEEGVLGYAVVFSVGEEAELLNLCVDRGCRRMGVASALLRRSFERLEERRVKKLFLEVRVSNRSARSLYERRGFHMVGLRKGYYHTPKEDALILKRTI